MLFIVAVYIICVGFMVIIFKFIKKEANEVVFNYNKAFLIYLFIIIYPGNFFFLFFRNL